MSSDSLYARQAVALFQFDLEISESISALHRRRIVHRDLHPANVFLYKNATGFHVIVADLGQSVCFTDAEQVKAAIVQAGADDTERDLEVGYSLQLQCSLPKGFQEVAVELEKKLQVSYRVLCSRIPA